MTKLPFGEIKMNEYRALYTHSVTALVLPAVQSYRTVVRPIRRHFVRVYDITWITGMGTETLSLMRWGEIVGTKWG